MKFYDVVCELLMTVFHITTILRVLTQVQSKSDRFTGKVVFLSSTYCEVTLPLELPSSIYVVLSCCLSDVLFEIKL